MSVVRVSPVAPADLAEDVARLVEAGGRFVGLFGRELPDGGHLLRAAVTDGGELEILESVLPNGIDSYPALTRLTPGAAWYERELHDTTGIVPLGHPRLDPLVVSGGGSGESHEGQSSAGSAAVLPAHVSGEGVFTIPYGPVRSGVFEAIEYLVETFGEDIPHLRTRVYHKHRAISERFSGLPIEDGVLLAERVEGVSSVAHAASFSQAVESLSGCEVPRPALSVRLFHAELERIVNHLDSVIRHCEGAGQAVANARLSYHKEQIMRLRARACGNRFGRGVVVPGGVSAPLAMEPGEAEYAVARFGRALTSDLDALMGTPSFLDRLRGTGKIPSSHAASHGAVGPVGRGSGQPGDVRFDEPYGAYHSYSFKPVDVTEAAGDALARQFVRIDEIRESLRLAERAANELRSLSSDAGLRVSVPPSEGLGVSAVESPQGELLYLVEVEAGRIVWVKPRCASFHNLAIFPSAFGGDILTDFVFIEASFGLSIAGAAG